MIRVGLLGFDSVPGGPVPEDWVMALPRFDPEQKPVFAEEPDILVRCDGAQSPDWRWLHLPLVESVDGRLPVDEIRETIRKRLRLAVDWISQWCSQLSLPELEPIFEEALEALEPKIAQLRQEILAGELDAAGKTSHSIKGFTAMTGMNEISAIAGRLCDGIRKSTLQREEIEAIFSEIAGYGALVRLYLQK